jgi:hypothetical protein
LGERSSFLLVVLSGSGRWLSCSGMIPGGI